jgi:hypothetical protein
MEVIIVPEKVTEIVSPTLPKGVTEHEVVLTRRTVHLILTGQLLPSPNAIHALAMDWIKHGPQRDDL